VCGEEVCALVLRTIVRASHCYTALVFTYDVLLLLWQRTLKQTKGYKQKQTSEPQLVCYHNIYNSNCSSPAVVQFGLN
jgi:hypothetical protein